MKHLIILGSCMTLIFGLMTWITFQNLTPRHQSQVNQLTKENIAIAKQYHQLVQQHKDLNQQYTEKHGYVSQKTNTKGALFIVPYGSKSNSEIEIHTPAMVKIEYQQKDLKQKFDHNNDRLLDYNAPTVALSDHHGKKLALISSAHSSISSIIPYFTLGATILTTVIWVSGVTMIAMERRKRHLETK